MAVYIESVDKYEESNKFSRTNTVKMKDQTYKLEFYDKTDKLYGYTLFNSQEELNNYLEINY